MGKNFTLLILIWLLFFCVRSNVTAQKVVSTLSTKAGTITYTEGKPALFTKRKISSQATSLGPGDNLQTQARDRIEIELNPGSYLRIGGRARVTVLETVLDRMHFQIDEGVVIVDTGTLDRKYHSLQLSSPSGDFRISQKGLCRVEVNDSGIVEVLVHKGSVECWRGSQKIATLRSGKHYQLKGSGDSSFLQSSLVGRKKDSIDEWSQSRSNYLKGGPFGKGHPQSRTPGF